jgi:hypothetical protein
MQKYTITVVEDDFITAQWMEKSLVELGHRVVDATQRKHADVVLVNSQSQGVLDSLQNTQKVVLFSTQLSPNIKADEGCLMLHPFNRDDITTLLRAATQKNYIPHTVHLGEHYYYDLDSRLLKEGQRGIKLSKILNRLLYTLCLYLDKTLSNQKLIELVWRDKKVSSSTIRDTIKRLRNTLPFVNIQTVSGVGYSLKINRS